jgi:hypothetical protein
MSCVKSQPHQRIIKHDPYISWENAVEFRLLYDGSLLGSSRTNTRASHKHEIRRVFHKQLKRLWDTTPRLKRMALESHAVQVGNAPQVTVFNLDRIADNFRVGNYRCVPLITTELELACGLDILFLRHDQPGATLIQSGDIDNRLKTLFDSLRRPQTVDETCGEPTTDENPLFCLLEDDKLITRVGVTTDLLLEPNRDVNDVRLIITVKIRPMAVTFANIELGF